MKLGYISFAFMLIVSLASTVYADGLLSDVAEGKDLKPEDLADNEAVQEGADWVVIASAIGLGVLGLVFFAIGGGSINNRKQWFIAGGIAWAIGFIVIPLGKRFIFG